jgi:FKBP-type peptidyl-prolyl cis-trans isomerase
LIRQFSLASQGVAYRVIVNGQNAPLLGTSNLKSFAAEVPADMIGVKMVVGPNHIRIEVSEISKDPKTFLHLSLEEFQHGQVATTNQTSSPVPLLAIDLNGQKLKKGATLDYAFNISATASPTTNDLGTDEGITVNQDVEGDGPEGVPGKLVQIRYTATAMSGEDITTVKKTFHLGSDEAFLGLNQAVKGMKVGGTRWVDIPANLRKGDASKVSKVAGDELVEYSITLLATE